MITIVILLPIILGSLSLLLKNKFFSRAVLIGNSLLFVIIAFLLWIKIEWYWLPDWFLNYFRFDAIGLFFFSIMTLVFAGVAVYSLFYFKEQGLSSAKEAVFAAEILFFIAAMTGVILATHLALLWVFVEATTLTSALLIYFEKKKSSLEAAWKYVYICSIGIALAFVGIIILSIGSRSFDSLFFQDLYSNASKINPLWLKVSFAFIFVGLGTKIGIAPLHAWLPDAHSEAPSPVSALLSGTLLNSAFLGLIRFQEIFVRANLEEFSNFFFLLTGFLSLMVSSVFMLRLKNYKRMLAYSSIENMGILFIGITLGQLGVFAAMLHTLAHSLSKTSLFLTSGNILSLFKSKKIEDVKGILKTDSYTGWLWIISMISIIGIPPSPVFISKFFIIKAFWLKGMGWLAVLFFLFLIIVAYGMCSAVFNMAFGESKLNEKANQKLSVFAYVPQLILLIILLILGINLPSRVLEFLNNTAGFFK
jgi:hydrogenase-4 component F